MRAHPFVFRMKCNQFCSLEIPKTNFESFVFRKLRRLAPQFCVQITKILYFTNHGVKRIYRGHLNALNLNVRLNIFDPAA